MAQFNLLPAVKLEYIKARRIKRLMTLASIIASAVGLAVLLIMFTTVKVVQKKSLSDLDKDVTKYSTQLKAVPDLDKILTVQNQLNTINGLHDKATVSSRLFGYLGQVTPTQASISNLQIDFTANTMTIDGAAPTLDVVSNFTDTLKGSKYSVQGVDGTTKAFTSVVLTGFSRTDTSASYDITLTFDPVLFDGTQDVKLIVPTGSSTNQSQLFGTTGN